MEEIPFVIVFRGAMEVYSHEHAKNAMNELNCRLREEIRDMNDSNCTCRVRNVVTKIGDETEIDFEWDFFSSFVSETRKEIDTIVCNFLDSMAKKLDKPPFFDRRDYIEVRQNLLDEIRRLKGDYTLRGYSNEIAGAARRIDKSVRSGLKYDLKHNVIRWVEDHMGAGIED